MQRKRRFAGNAPTDDLYRIRPARRADLRTLAAIEQLVFSDPWPMSGFEVLLGDFSLVAERGGKVVGYVFARVAADEAEILNLAVHPTHRRQGLGRHLLKSAIEAAMVSGAKRVFLEVRASNEGAQAFYARLGFRVVGRRQGYYERPKEDALILARSLGATERSA